MLEAMEARIYGGSYLINRYGEGPGATTKFLLGKFVIGGNTSEVTRRAIGWVIGGFCAEKITR